MVVSAEKRDEQMDEEQQLLKDQGKNYPYVRMGWGVLDRQKQVMTWRLPNRVSVQMYINPENFVFSERKQINFTRTKGGFVVQYWGDDLAKINISGTTGSSGVEGINVLRGIYHAEQNTFDSIAAAQANDVLNELETTGDSTTDGDIGTKLIPNITKQMRDRNFLLRPSLGSLALGMVLYYQGVQYKGFFTEMSVTESIYKLGLFDYNMTFMVTEVRGVRSNFMPWHKMAVASDMVGPPALRGANSLKSLADMLRQKLGVSPGDSDPTSYHPSGAPLYDGAQPIRYLTPSTR